MERIVVGTDLTDRGNAAVNVAADLARQLGAALHVVAVCRIPVVTASPQMPPPVIDMSAQVDDAGQQVQALADRLRNGDLQVETHVLAGDPANGLCDVAETVDADLLVVGNRRMKGAGRVLGSVPNRVAHKADCNVLIVRTGDG